MIGKRTVEIVREKRPDLLRDGSAAGGSAARAPNAAAYAPAVDEMSLRRRPGAIMGALGSPRPTLLGSR